MKRILSIFFILLILAACQPTPDAEFIVNKGDGRLAEAVSRNGEGFSVAAYRSALPAVWEESVDTHQSAVTLSFCAEVVFPDVDALPTVEVAPRGNDLNALPWFAEHMAQGGYFARIPIDANGEKLRTKDVILSEIENSNSLIEQAEQLHPDWDAEQIAVYRDSLERESAALAEEYRNAPDATAERIDDLASLQNGGMTQLGLYSKSGHCIADVTLVFDRQNPQREQIYICAGSDPECFSYWQEPINDTQTAILCAEQILKELGYDAHYTVAETAEGAAGIGVTFAPKVKDIGYSLGGEDPIASYDEYFPEDKLELIFTRGTGILRCVDWTGNSSFVREASQNVELLPFAEIQAIAKNNLGYLLSWTNENISERTIEVRAVRLEYKRVRILNDQRRLLVPAWTVEGTVTDRGVVEDADTGRREPFIAETVSGPLLVINAIDGSIIQTGN